LCAIERAAEEVRGGMLAHISERVERWHLNNTSEEAL